MFSGRGELITKVGTVLSAIMASSCCWLPPLLLLMGVSGAGLTNTLQTYRPVFVVVTFGFLGSAFYLTYRPRRTAGGDEDCCAQPAKGVGRRFNMMTLNKVMLWAVTVMAVVFLFFPQYVGSLFGSSGEVTAEMHHTVINVTGMTCSGCELAVEKAIQTVPGVLAVKADHDAGQAAIGTEPGQHVPTDDILASLESIGYHGEFLEQLHISPPTSNDSR